MDSRTAWYGFLDETLSFILGFLGPRKMVIVSMKLSMSQIVLDMWKGPQTLPRSQWEVRARDRSHLE